MTTPRLQREFDRLHVKHILVSSNKPRVLEDPVSGRRWRALTDREVEAFFEGKPMRYHPLPRSFYLLVGVLALGTAALYALALLQ